MRWASAKRLKLASFCGNCRRGRTSAPSSFLCPKALVTDRKWERDLRRFDERFTQLDLITLRFCIDERNSTENGRRTMRKRSFHSPYSTSECYLEMMRRLGLFKLDTPPKFDLLIVDEAHRLRIPATYAHQAVRFFAAHAEAVFFLTATPIQLGSDDLSGSA